MPNDQSHDTRTTDPLQRAVQAVNLEVAYRAGGTGPTPPTFTLSANSSSITANITNSNGATSYEIRVDSGTPVVGLTVTGLNAEQAYSVQVRGYTGADAGAWSTAVSKATSAEAPAGVIFQENFDSQPDWTSTMHSISQRQDIYLGDTMPNNWTGIYQTTDWSPETGYPNKHATLEILSANADKARGGTGKSAVMWREKTGSGWDSDSDLIKVFDQDSAELHVRFFIRFSENWICRSPDPVRVESKMFRIFHWDRVGDLYSGINDNAVGPMCIWRGDHSGAYGTRNMLAFRQGAPGYAYYPEGEWAWSSSNQRNFTDHLQGQGPGGADSTLPDALDGTPLVNKVGQVISHDQVWGPSSTWTQMDFWVKMNSAPGVADGEMRQWINGHRTRTISAYPWVIDGPMVGWTGFGIGGNDRWYGGPDPSELFEDWYAFDDLTVWNTLPEDLE